MRTVPLVLRRIARLARIAAAIAAAILAVAVATSLTVDLGPAVRRAAEDFGSRAWKRPIHLGRLGIKLFGGRIVADDVRIDGLEPTDRPFFTARHIEVDLDWSTLLQLQHPTRPEITISRVDMVDWQMLVEKWAWGSNFVDFKAGSDQREGPKRFTTTLKSLRAWRGQFTYEDHEAPWSIVARNIDLRMTNLPGYHGQVSFQGGTVAIQDHLPFYANMTADYRLDGSLVHLDRIEFDTEGARTSATGDVDLSHWPEQSYRFTSHVQLPVMRRLFFEHEAWDVTGEADFAGTFHLFKGGRDLSGSFESSTFGVNGYRFASVRGGLRWTPAFLHLFDGEARIFGGRARFTYNIEPLGRPTPAVMRFAADASGIDLASVTDFYRLAGLRFAGTAAADHLVLEWPSGRFAERRGRGRIVVEPPPGAGPMMTDSLEEARAADCPPLREWGPFAPVPLPQHLPIAGELAFRFDPEEVAIDVGRFATERTYVAFAGTTAWGRRGRIAFHATSRDWQESDELLAGIMTDFGSPRRPVTFGGRGRFDGVMTGPFRSPSVEGDFTGEDLRAFDTLWGDGRAHVVVENDYVRVDDGRIVSGASEMRVDGLFSLGFPREDGGVEIDARIRVAGRDVASLRHAFGIDEYPIAGSLSGEFHLSGEYRRPVGFGAMRLEPLVAYGEPFARSAASLRFDGTGVRLDGISVDKEGGAITGAAFIGWDGTYSFNLDGRGIPVARIARLQFPRVPLSGVAEFSASGSATFEQPRNDYRIRVADAAAGRQPIGEVTAMLALRGSDLSGSIDAASPRLAITASGRVALTPAGDSDLTIRFHDIALDPYIRPFVPQLSPAASAVASGSVRVSGALADPDRVLVDGTVESVELRLFDYVLRNADPIRLALADRRLAIVDLRLVGDETALRIGGDIDLRDRRIAVRADGDAHLGILQGFFRDVRGAGRAVLRAAVEGPLASPVVSGRATITDGRIRHFSLPSSLDAINGVVSFDQRGIRFDELTARMGGGAVQFGGRVAIDGYRLGELNVTVRGEGVQLRLAEGLRSTIDADLTLRGNVRAPILGGSVLVRSAVYTRRIEAPETILDFALRRPIALAAPSAGEPGPATSVPLRYDVEINAPSTLRMDNNLGRIRANVALTLRGSYDRPVFFGHVEVEAGQLTYKGKRYRLTKGIVDFTNPNRIEPFFDVEAETSVRVAGQTYLLTVGGTGPPQKLVPSWNSDPPLPAADILALLFSDVRPSGDVELRSLQPTERQNELLAASAAETIAKPITEAGRIVQRTIGVDTFQLTPFLTDVTSGAPSSRLNPTARLTIGKRISDRVFLTFSRSLASSINDQIILLEYEASDRVSWMLSRNEDSQTYALEFRVRHSY